jgi:hypothetical protein
MTKPPGNALVTLPQLPWLVRQKWVLARNFRVTPPIVGRLRKVGKRLSLSPQASYY